MRKFLAALVCLVGFPCLSWAQTVTLEVDAGVLRTKPANAQTSLGTPMQDGMLLQLIASPSGVFGAPAAGSFVSGDDVVFESYAMDSSTTGVTGETDASFPPIKVTPASGAILSPNEKFEIRWYPTLTFNNTTLQNGPAAGTTFGQYRSDSDEGFGVGDAPWVIPAAGSTVEVLFTTVSSQFGGPRPDTDGNANMVVTPIPEPSTCAMVGLAALGLAGMKLRQRRARQS